ncbi:hypothetical protein ACN47E_006543 [Coniothyrium glycines]
MSDEKLCEICQKLFHKENCNTQWKDYRHHEEAGSLQEALELPCGLCVRIIIALARDFDEFKPLASARGSISPNSRALLHMITPMSYMLFHEVLKYGYTELDQLIFYFGKEYASVLHIELDKGGFSRALRHELETYSSVNLDCERSMRFLASQLKECLGNHATCRGLVDVQKEFMPSRLIDVGQNPESGLSVVHLRQSPLKDSYATLSHCWGQSQSLLLTKAQEANFKQGIRIEDLPRTFQHAITVTRALQIGYIWIDSLCIYQDDISDWSIQSRCMKDIYEGAVICIAATAAKDGTGGLFSMRDNLYSRPIPIDIPNCLTDRNEQKSFAGGKYWIGDYDFSASQTLAQSPLNRRAWVAQERFLSKRIAHFAERDLYWECQQTLSSRTFPNGVYDRHEVIGLQPPSLRRTLIGSSTRHRENVSHEHVEDNDFMDLVYRAWVNWLVWYTGRDITKEEDIFVALNGVSQVAVVETMGDRMIAGLCESRLDKQLIWQILNSTKEHRPRNWRAPSWSWASTTAQIIWPSEDPTHSHDVIEKNSMIKILESRMEMEQSGELKEASVWIECRPFRVGFKDNSTEENRHDESTRFSNWEVWYSMDGMTRTCQKSSLSINLDDSPEHIPDDLYLMLVNHTHLKNDRFGPSSHVEGIALSPFESGFDNICRPHRHGPRIIPHDTTYKRFRRIGVFHEKLDPEWVRELEAHLLQKYHDTEPQIIELV